MGGEHAIIAREGERGRLFLRVNEGDVSDNGGAFSVDIRTETRKATCSPGLDRRLVVMALNVANAQLWNRTPDPDFFIGPWPDRMASLARWMKNKVPDVLLLSEIAIAGGAGDWTDDLRGLRPGAYVDFIVAQLELQTGEHYAVASNPSGFLCRVWNEIGGDAILYRTSRLDPLRVDERFGRTVNSKGHYANGAILRNEHYRTHHTFGLQLGGDGPCIGNTHPDSYDRGLGHASVFEFPVGSGRYLIMNDVHSGPGSDWERYHPWMESIIASVPGPAYPPILGGDVNYTFDDWTAPPNPDNPSQFDDPARAHQVGCLLRDWKPITTEKGASAGFNHIYQPNNVWATALPAELIRVSPDAAPNFVACGSNWRHDQCPLSDHEGLWVRLEILNHLRGEAPFAQCRTIEDSDWCPLNPDDLETLTPLAVDICGTQHTAVDDTIMTMECKCDTSTASPSITAGRLVSVSFFNDDGSQCQLQPGKTLTAAITYENTGTTTWSQANGTYLQSRFEGGLWDFRLPMASNEVVPPLSSYTFQIRGITPATESDVNQLANTFVWDLHSVVLGKVLQELAIPWPTLTACNTCGDALGTPTACTCADGRSDAGICPGTPECQAFCDPCYSHGGVCNCNASICSDHPACSMLESETCCNAASGFWCVGVFCSTCVADAGSCSRIIESGVSTCL